MARVITDEQTLIVRPWQLWLKVVIIGLVMGFAYWAITMMLARYVIEPLACREVVDAARCSNAIGLGGNISAVLTALLALVTMIRLNVVRPVVIAVGAGALLWSLAAWTAGLWWLEALAWSILVGGLSFGLFAWIVRTYSAVVAAVVAVIVVVAIQIFLQLS